MKYIKTLILLSFISFHLQAKRTTDVIDISLVMNGGDHTISTYIGSDINDIYSVIYRYGNSSGDEFGMPIYVLSPKLVKYIERYIQSQGFFYSFRPNMDSLFYSISFKSLDVFGFNHYFEFGVGGRAIAKSYFWWMLRWIESYSSKEDSPEFKEFVAFIQSDFIDFEALYTPLQYKRAMDRWHYEDKLRNAAR